jgi:tetratricopeptide (TPR) repeat protein
MRVFFYRAGVVLLSFLTLTALPGFGQTPQQAPVDRAAAYYHAALAHMYEELAGSYGGRGEYVGKAIDNYRLALKADPSSAFLAEELADLYIQSGQLRSAVSDFEEAVKRDPSDVNARRILGRIYTAQLRAGQQNRLDEKALGRALEQYQKISELAPQDANNWVMLGRLEKLGQHSSEAEKAYKKALELEPENADAMTGLAMVYSDLGDAKGAADMLKKVAEKTPTLNTLTALAATYEQMKEFKLAAQAYGRALELNPGNTDLKRAYAQSLFTAEDYDAAQKVFEEIVAEEPTDAASLLRLSQIARQRRDFTKAREYGKKASEADSNNLEIRYNDVSLLEAEGKVPEAINALKSLLDGMPKRPESMGERNNRVILLERLGYLYRSEEQTDKAVATFHEIAEVDPDSGARAAAQAIEAYRGGKDFAGAEKEAEAALKKYPSDRVVKVTYANVMADLGKFPAATSTLKGLLDGKNDRETWLALAQVYEKAKNHAEMAKAIDEADKLSTTNDEKEGVYFVRGAMYERTKKYDLAEAEFKKVLAINPASASTLNYLGYMLVDRNVRLQEGLDMIKKALDQDPYNGAFLDSLGWAYYRMNRLDEAAEQLQHSLERGARDPTVHDHLGDVYMGQGKVKEAVGQWERSIEEWHTSAPGDVDSSEIAKVQKKIEGGKVRLAKENGAAKQP